MTLPYYASAEQIMRDRSELARKGIGRGRSVIALIYADGVLFVAENPSKALHKISELYDRVGFAAVGKYNEFESLRRSGIMHADMRGYAYDRRLLEALRASGWAVSVLRIDGAWPWPDAATLAEAQHRFAQLPDGCCVVADGLAFGVLGDVVAAHARRLGQRLRVALRRL